jgi:hypothetical protein
VLGRVSVPAIQKLLVRPPDQHLGTRLSLLTQGWSVILKLDQVASVNTIRIRLGHESLDVTLAYLKGQDAESEETQEHANSSSLALYA